MKYFLIFFSIIFVFNDVFGIFATVNLKEANFYDKDGKIVETLPFGTVVNAKKLSSDGRVEVFFNQKMGWMDRGSLIFYDNNFSDIYGKSKIIGSFNNVFYFYFKEKIFKYEIIDRKILNKIDLKGVFDIFPSTKENIFLIEGVTTNDLREIHNFLIYNENKSVYIGSFDSKIVKVENVKFINDSEILAILFNRNGKRHILIYKTLNGKLLGYSSDADGVFDLMGRIFLYNKKYIWYFDEREANNDFTKEKLVFNIPLNWLSNNEFDFKVEGKYIYVQTKKGVVRFDLNTKDISVTSFNSLEWNKDMTKNIYRLGNVEYIFDVENNKRMRLPKDYTFQSFVSDGYIFYGKYGKINTYFLFDRTGEEKYRYRAIDKADFIFDNGIMVDIIFDSDMCTIFIEDPAKKRYFVEMVKE